MNDDIDIYSTDRTESATLTRVVTICKIEGCKEFTSDSDDDNLVSFTFHILYHEKLRFWRKKQHKYTNFSICKLHMLHFLDDNEIYSPDIMKEECNIPECKKKFKYGLLFRSTIICKEHYFSRIKDIYKLKTSFIEELAKAGVEALNL